MKTWHEHIREVLRYISSENEEAVKKLILEFLNETHSKGYKRGYKAACLVIRDFADAKLDEVT